MGIVSQNAQQIYVQCGWKPQASQMNQKVNVSARPGRDQLGMGAKVEPALGALSQGRMDEEMSLTALA
jgi:hypothetical protein